MNLPATELNNATTREIDTLDTQSVLALINKEDAKVAQAVQTQLPHIARAVDGIVARLKRGGRLIYLGAGTSGRLGVLDASEMPPTFSTPPGLVIGIIAGGDHALRNPIEGAEDDAAQGVAALDEIGLNERDAVVGLAASGRTPYVIGALNHARRAGALTISLACSAPAAVHEAAEINIAPIVGPEVIAGSTRMKAGTAQKLVLNMMSTAIMIRLGKTFGNLMVDVRPSNAKLRERAVRIVTQAAQVDVAEAQRLLDSAKGEVKTAIVMSLLKVEVGEARTRLARAGGIVREAMGFSAMF